jgi:hypothetical protein
MSHLLNNLRVGQAKPCVTGRRVLNCSMTYIVFVLRVSDKSGHDWQSNHIVHRITERGVAEDYRMSVLERSNGRTA